MTSLAVRQRLFARLAAHLILEAYRRGYEVSLGEAWRSPETMRLYKRLGKGAPNSLHGERLAIDINLFKGGKWLRRTEDHRELGEWWERQHPLCRWGGRFGDGNHYSIEWRGMK